MTKIGHAGGCYEVTVGKAQRDDVLEDLDFRQFHYTAKPGVLEETGPWEEAKKRAFAYAEKKKAEGFRYTIRHHQTHVIASYGGPRK